MKKIIALAIAALLIIPAATAANTDQDPQTTKEQHEKALESANWFIPMSYGGFDFEIPAGSVVKKDSKLLVTYPDGSFGVSMENEGVGSNQKIAFEMARSYGSKFKLADLKVDKVKIGGVDGAQATGRLEGHNVTVLILPVNDQQVTTVLMATPDRTEWTDHFIQSMKH